jgi:hypothetical protein
MVTVFSFDNSILSHLILFKKAVQGEHLPPLSKKKVDGFTAPLMEIHLSLPPLYGRVHPHDRYHALKKRHCAKESAVPYCFFKSGIIIFYFGFSLVIVTVHPSTYDL